MRKCRGIEDIAAMELAQDGVRTRAKAALAMADTSLDGRTPKRRKINNEQLKFSQSSFVHLEPESELPPQAEETDEDDRCSSPISDEFPASCCSSNGSIDEHRIKFVDLEVESAQVETSTCNCSADERREEMSPSSEHRTSSEDLGSTEKSTEANTPRVSKVQKMPTELELDEFFAAAEEDIQKRFADKYNYDIAKDEPLEGRYEWVPLKP